MSELFTNNKKNPIEKIDFIGFFMVISPLISSILLWYWLFYIEMLEEITKYFFAVLAGTVLFTTILATIDSHRLGLKIKIYGRKEIYGGSFLKFFVFLLLWIYAYPVYLFRRKYYGGRNLLYPLIFSLIVFVFSAGYMYFVLEKKQIEDEAFQRRKMHQRILR